MNYRWKRLIEKQFLVQLGKSVLVLLVCIQLPQILNETMPPYLVWFFSPVFTIFIGGAIYGAYEFRCYSRKHNATIQWQARDK